MAFDKDFENMRGVIYQCVRCGKKFSGEHIALRGRIACPECGFRVIKKIKPPIVHRLKTV